MKIIIFGASGKTGKLLVEQALSDNHRVTAFVRNPSNLNISNPNLVIVQGDATDASDVKKLFLGMMQLFQHLERTLDYEKRQYFMK